MKPMVDCLRLLVVEDHVELAKNLCDYFDSDRYVMDFAQDGLTALHLLTTNSYDVIILDIMLPGLSGFEVCRRLREDLQCHTPVIMVTAKDQLQDKEEGFSTGADDYLVKPFHLRELQLRIESISRRQDPGNIVRLRAGSVSFDPGTLQVHVEGYPSLELGGTAARIFEAMIRTYPNYISYDDLNDKIWGDHDADLNTLRTHVYTLRKQLQAAFGQPLVKTLHSRGYRLAPPAEA
jgi:DNA-binding response OmpR family regulator